jgi:hypothetical protein
MVPKTLKELSLGDILVYPDGEVIGAVIPISSPASKRWQATLSRESVLRGERQTGSEAFFVFQGQFHLWFIAGLYLHDTTKARELGSGVGHRRYDHLKHEFMINPEPDYNDYETFLNGNILELWIDLQSLESLDKLRIYTV